MINIIGTIRHGTLKSPTPTEMKTSCQPHYLGIGKLIWSKSWVNYFQKSICLDTVSFSKFFLSPGWKKTLLPNVLRGRWETPLSETEMILASQFYAPAVGLRSSIANAEKRSSTCNASRKNPNTPPQYWVERRTNGNVPRPGRPCKARYKATGLFSKAEKQSMNVFKMEAAAVLVW